MSIKFKLGEQVIELDEAQARQLHADLDRLFGGGAAPAPAVTFIPICPPPVVIREPLPTPWRPETTWCSTTSYGPKQVTVS